jgi:hypothetical protein
MARDGTGQLNLLQISIHLQHSVLFGKDGRFSAHPKWTERFSKALLSSVFGGFCWLLLNFYCVFVRKEVLLHSKKPFCPFWMWEKTFWSFRMDRFFPFVANELKFVVKITGKNGIKKLDSGSNFSKKYKNFPKGSRYF